MSRTKIRLPKSAPIKRRRRLLSERLEDRRLLDADYQLLKDINPGAASALVTSGSNLSPYAKLGNLAIFSADDGSHGIELWKSDGSAAGTELLKDLYPGSEHGRPTNFTVVGDELYFTANLVLNTSLELWKTDGTAAGTSAIQTIPIERYDSMGNFTSVLLTGDSTPTLFFTNDEIDHGQELWKSDGTTLGTGLVRDINLGASNAAPRNLIDLNGSLYFEARGPLGTEIYVSDGSYDGTTVLKDIRPGSSSSTSNTHNLTKVGQTLYFAAEASSAQGIELWKSDGTSAGTVLVKDIYTGSSDSFPRDFVDVNGTVFFEARDVLFMDSSSGHPMALPQEQR